MNYAIHRIYLDIHDTTSQATIYVKRNDSNRKIVATLMENGKPYSISSECQVGFSSKALPMPVYCEIKDNTIEYVLSTSVTKSVGIHECEFKLYGKDNAVLTSPRFTVIVEDVIYDGDDITEDTPNVSVLDSLISKATTLIDDVTTKLEKGEFNGKDGVDGVIGKDGYTPIKNVDYFDGKDGKDGADGYTPIKNKDYFDGKDGVSATHSWNGTTLTITSASGTSSANLKGDKGDRGEKGDSYILTTADKQEITNNVLNALPTYNGEVAEV